MASVLNRATGEYIPSVNTPDFPAKDWIINPDLSAVTGVPGKYWKIDGDTVSPMSRAERDAVDAAEEVARKNEIVGRFDEQGERMADILVLLELFNRLARVVGGVAEIDLAAYKTEYRSRL